MDKKEVKSIQNRILEIMLFIDNICRKNNIEYFIMGGTALGAVRHKGFIPWDDDLDIFMTPNNYKKFKHIFKEKEEEKFIIQEWKIVENYLEYSKVRMNGTTFIEECFEDNKEMHHGIYVDIMILHKCPENIILQKKIYFQSKYVTLYALSKRNWKPKNLIQKIILNNLKFIPNKLLSNWCYKNIYKYDNLKDNFKWCYFITPAKFKQGVFEKEMFENPVDIEFEGKKLLGSQNIKEYLKFRYGNYMKLPSENERKMAVHAKIFDAEKDYKEYIGV